MIFILTILFLFQLIFISKILEYFILSPIYLYILFAIVSIISSVLYFYFYDNKFSLYSLDKVSETSFIDTIKWYLIALNSFIFGFLIYHNFSRRKARDLFKESLIKKLFFTYNLPKHILKIVNFLFLIIIILFLIAYGKGLLFRNQYLPETNRILVILIKIFSFVEIMLLGIIYYKFKQQSILYFIILFFLTIGTGSRVVILFLLIYFTLIFISKGNNIKNKLIFTFNLFFTFVFLGFLMQFRRQDYHGIFPYIQSIFSLGGDPLRDFYFNIYYSFVFGVYVTIATIKNAIPDWNVIFISLNPLPGKMAGWYEISSKMRLNTFAPFSLHGRVFSMGLLFTIFYFIITGIIFSVMEKMVRIYLKKDNREIAFLLILLLVLHIVYGFEYNLRSAVRYLYYSIGVIFIFKLLKIFISRLKSIRKNDN